MPLYGHTQSYGLQKRRTATRLAFTFATKLTTAPVTIGSVADLWSLPAMGMTGRKRTDGKGPDNGFLPIVPEHFHARRAGNATSNGERYAPPGQNLSRCH